MQRKRRRVAILAAAALLTAGTLAAHDLFLKLESYFLEPHSRATVALLNGTFERSDNAVARDRMLDVSVAGPGPRVVHPPETAWRDSAVWADTAILEFETGEPGTYVLGVSTAPRVIELSGEDFDEYLRHDGVLDMLEERRRKGLLGTPARERYSKHVKAVVQVGDRRTGGYGHRLGYPVELIPLRNPYELGVGDTFPALFLRDGEPVPNHLVYASYHGHHAHADDGTHREAVTTRTDADGVARIPLSTAGRWYVRLIHMEEVREEGEEGEEGLDYESNWATLTFEVR